MFKQSGNQWEKKFATTLSEVKIFLKLPWKKILSWGKQRMTDEGYPTVFTWQWPLGHARGQSVFLFHNPDLGSPTVLIILNNLTNHKEINSSNLHKDVSIIQKVQITCQKDKSLLGFTRLIGCSPLMYYKSVESWRLYNAK